MNRSVSRRRTVKARLLATAAGVAMVPLVLSNGALAQSNSSSGGGIETVMVTAQRVSQDASKVPISVQAFTQQDIDKQGLTNISDIAAKTPDLTYNSSGSRQSISIRGITSGVGAATTGVYIDDTPIQIRNAGFTSSATFPALFDLNRVEVLRGPQGTLFGAGSEGGTIRFITNQPNLNDSSIYARGDISGTQSGGPGFEGGVAFGAPIVDGKLAFRASADFHQQAGWLDRVDPNTGQIRDSNANWVDTDVQSLAVTYAATPQLTVTASFYHQDTQANDSSGYGQYWLRLSDPSRGQYKSGDLLNSPFRDQLYLPSLKVEYDFGGVTFVSNTAYMYRNEIAHPDYTQFVTNLGSGNPVPTSDNNYARGDFLDMQHFFTEEARLQSTDQDARLTWVAGVFYQWARQTDDEIIPMASFPAIVQAARGKSYLAVYGTPLGPNNSVYTDLETVHDKQIAGYAQADFKITPALVATAGIRYGQVSFDFHDFNYGPFAGQGEYQGSQSSTPLTPKAALTYHVDDDAMIYASASRGFRPGGAERIPGNACASDLNALGFANAPNSYNPDSVWNYELGGKSRFFGGRVQTDLALYYMKWNNIQQSVSLRSCGQTLIANLGSATVKGFDLNAQVQATDQLYFNIGISDTNAAYDQTISNSGAKPLINKGDPVGGTIPWRIVVGAQYDFKVEKYDSYLRLDYTYTGPGHFQDPQLSGYNPNIPPAPDTSLMSARLGASVSDKTEISAYIDNLLNAHPQLGLYEYGVSSLYTANTFTPRTIGMRLIYRE